METQWLPVSLVVWITALAGTLDARQQVRFVALCTGLLFARGRRTVASWLRACGAGATTSAITTCSAASDARPWRSPGSCSASSLSGSRAMGRARRWSSPSTTRPPSGTGRTSRALASSQPHSGTGRVPVPLRPRLGLSGPPGPTLALGSDCPADPLALVHPSQRCRLDGGLLRLAVPHQVGAGRRPDRVAGPAVGARSPADLGGNRRGLRQAAVLEAGAGCGGDGDQSAAVRCGLVVVAAGGRSRPEEGSWPAAEVRQGPDRPGQRAAQTRGWQTGLFSLYGRLVVKKYKTFLATYKPVGGVIRVVLVREPDRWVAYFSTDPDLSVASILETVADRSALEQVFHDVKEVHGAGQQQLRHVWANVGAWNLIGWWHTLVELWAWDRPQSRLRDRSDSPWDKPERRPSHAYRCQELRREALQEEYSSLPSVRGLRRKIRRFIQRSCAERMRLTVLGKCSLLATVGLIDVEDERPLLRFHFKQLGTQLAEKIASPPIAASQDRLTSARCLASVQTAPATREADILPRCMRKAITQRRTN